MKDCRAASTDVPGFGVLQSSVLTLRGPMLQMTVEQGDLKTGSTSCLQDVVSMDRELKDPQRWEHSLHDKKIEECAGEALFVTKVS
jgi:hypothetical protein